MPFLKVVASRRKKTRIRSDKKWLISSVIEIDQHIRSINRKAGRFVCLVQEPQVRTWVKLQNNLKAVNDTQLVQTRVQPSTQICLHEVGL